jgi:hypothetical protein
MKSEEFQIGQEVECLNTETFLEPMRSYLRDRKGIVTNVYPSVRPDNFYCGRINQVRILWGKRNGRGKEKEIAMQPRDLKIVDRSES